MNLIHANKCVNIYATKSYLENLNNYYDIGYFDIWELSNGLTTVLLNTEKELIKNIK